MFHVKLTIKTHMYALNHSLFIYIFPPQGHLSEGYGKLCSIYLKLLITKMEFHIKVSRLVNYLPNPFIPEFYVDVVISILYREAAGFVQNNFCGLKRNLRL